MIDGAGGRWCPSFTFGDQDINSVNFNRITGVNNDARFLQVSLGYRC